MHLCRKEIGLKLGTNIFSIHARPISLHKPPSKLRLVTDRVPYIPRSPRNTFICMSAPLLISKLIYTPEIDHKSPHHLALAPETPESALVQ